MSADAEAAAPAIEFTVMTYNVGNGLAKPDTLTALLAEALSDIVCLQEVTSEQAQAFSQLRDQYPYQIVNGAGIPGKAILSRYRLIESEILDFYPDRPDLKALIAVEERLLTVLVAHPLPPRIHRDGIHFKTGTRAQIVRLGELASSGAAAIMVGDFNMTDHHEQYAVLEGQGLIDSFRASGKGAGYTLPVRLGSVRSIPFLRFDYIWHTSHFQTIRAWVGSDGGSDHLPVLARLAWKETT